MNYNDFVENWNKNILPNKYKYERKGQSLMNYLADVWFKEYKRISSLHFYDEKNIDCFYNDKLIPNTLTHLEKVWTNYPN